jgi:DnaJ like chaperone protein
MSTLRLLQQEEKKRFLIGLIQDGWRIFTRSYWLESADKNQIEDRKRAQNQRQVDTIAVTFFIAAIAAKLAKVDGPLRKEEIEGFRQAFSLPEVADGVSIEEAFREALKDKMDATHYAKRIARIYPTQKDLLEELVDALFKFAGLDAPLNPREILFLKGVVIALGFTEGEFRRILRCHTLPEFKDPYEMLGVDRKVTPSQLKSAYRKAVQHYHPDKFSGKDTPEELVTIAKERFTALTNAYEMIRIKRRFLR